MYYESNHHHRNFTQHAPFSAGSPARLLQGAPVLSGFLCRAADVQQPNVVSWILPKSASFQGRKLCQNSARTMMNESMRGIIFGHSSSWEIWPQLPHHDPAVRTGCRQQHPWCQGTMILVLSPFLGWFFKGKTICDILDLLWFFEGPQFWGPPLVRCSLGFYGLNQDD